MLQLHDVEIWNDVDKYCAEDDEKVNNFMAEKCCSDSCTNSFSIADVKTLRLNASTLNYRTDGANVLDTVLLGVIQSMYQFRDPVHHARTVVEERQRGKMIYMINGKTVCRAFFLFSYGISLKRFKRLLNVYKEEGLVENKHGKCKTLPSRTTSFETTKAVVQFIRNYSEDHGLFMPGRLANYKTIVKLLPSQDSKISVYKKYEAAEGENPRVTLPVFYRIWRECCNDVLVQLPRTDLCNTCVKFSTDRKTFSRLSEEERLECIKSCADHLTTVQTERKAFLDAIKVSRQNFKTSFLEKYQNVNGLKGKCSVMSYKKAIHLSFDYAQQIHIPTQPQQPGPLYFLVPYKVQIFGIMNDTDRTQLNYLIPEAVAVDKGSNSVISYLDQYLKHSTYGEAELLIHADNCVGQNKNHYVIAYLMRRIVLKMNSKITYSFLPVGHTKFGCDFAFGLIKKKLRHTPAYTLKDLELIVNESAPNLNSSIATGSEQGDTFIPVNDWHTFFDNKKFTAIRNLTDYQHFVCSSQHPMQVLCKKHFNDKGILHQLFKPEVQFSHKDRIQQILPLGLNDERKNYLYEKIRPFCKTECQDTLCPEPLSSILKKSTLAEQKLEPTPSTSGIARGRGRGTGTSVKLVKPSTSGDESKPKCRGRGRPRKTK